jgi:hypothetical protein
LNEYIINNIHQNEERDFTKIKFSENFIESYRESNISSEKISKINFMKRQLELYKKDLDKALPIF